MGLIATRTNGERVFLVEGGAPIVVDVFGICPGSAKLGITSPQEFTAEFDMPPESGKVRPLPERVTRWWREVFPYDVIVVNGHTTITVLDINRNQVRLQFDAPKHVRIDREEIYHKRQGDNRVGSNPR